MQPACNSLAGGATAKGEARGEVEENQGGIRKCEMES